jgi:hypothetical protein
MKLILLFFLSIKQEGSQVDVERAGRLATMNGEAGFVDRHKMAAWSRSKVLKG